MTQNKLDVSLLNNNYSTFTNQYTERYVLSGRIAASIYLL